ncbi:MAG TPA: LuxR C-terminal-related transcriptional regulator [Nocardioides sp.]|uniref:LuxR C-terminal-related transcriptional regulator n=1 Tax=Nocardioides sp. TaxID=35761 RepID=UPI002E2F4E38|nr:LuxR C-terminal-related transcriptional regulator [Nocardioides sp.]HEX5090469.1 LuxR C-terminal-related transcriptional regulator [Nocardioides sp.]
MDGGVAAGPEELERQGRAAYVRHDYDAVIDLWERAYAGHRAAGDDAGAVRLARDIASLHGVFRGDWAVAGGWLARARRLGDGAGPRERGWVALTTGMFELDRRRKDELYREAMAAAGEAGDGPLQLITMSYYGASLVHGDQVADGMQLLDEALAAVSAGEVADPVGVEEIFCQLFSACEVAYDVDRADQWLRVGTALAARVELPAVSAYCHTHFGGVMTAAGRWSEAERSLLEGIRLWNLSRRSLGAASAARLADLRVRQGRFEEAEALLAELNEDVDSARPRAALALAAGDEGRAREVLERALGQVEEDGLAAVPLLSQLVEVHLAAGHVEQARDAMGRLGADTAGRTPYAAAVAALARGQIAAASGEPGAASHLRDALEEFARAQLPLESARVRMELARACAAERPALAVEEARRALQVFRELQATRYADEATALLRSLGVRTPGARSPELLTAREAEVLELLGLGLSNRQIAERLVLSAKTVEHHVSRILAKLGLRNRSEAAAYAVRNPGAKVAGAD